MQTHLITYHDKDNRTLGVRILYDLTNKHALEFVDGIKKWAHALFPYCKSIRLESMAGGDVIRSIGV